MITITECKITTVTMSGVIVSKWRYFLNIEDCIIPLNSLQAETIIEKQQLKKTIINKYTYLWK